MGITGIICEFNPFHNGHQLLIDKAKKLCPENSIALIMSGNVVQRGELASFDKYTRASWGIKAGADIVFELPAVFSNAYAMQFARGGVFLLSQIPQVTDLVFGSENGDIVQLQKFSNELDNPDDKTNTAFRELLELGQSYPKVLS
ncbi:MAG: nucleotidyltransferase family protein, partial [Clostridia bacterium]